MLSIRLFEVGWEKGKRELSMNKEFFLRHIKQKKDIYGEIFKYSRCFDINNNINVFGVSANCLMEARSGEEETESGRELVFFRHIDLLSAYLQ